MEGRILIQVANKPARGVLLWTPATNWEFFTSNACIQWIQSIYPNKFAQQMDFCQWLLQQQDINPGFPSVKLFTDEAGYTQDVINSFC
jgi:hypothetical protein